MSEKFDVIIIGAGHNGLVAAAYLAKAGLRTIILERREVVGGAAATEEIYSGYQANTGAPDAGLFSKTILSDLQLTKYGLSFLESPALATSLLGGERILTIWRDIERTAEGIKAFSERDSEIYPQFVSYIRELSGLLGELLKETPPPLPGQSLLKAVPWLQMALKVRRDGGMMPLLRALPLPMRDLLDEWFESEELKGLLSVPAITGSSVGPYQAGTFLMYLYQNLGRGSGSYSSFAPVQGGVGQLSNSVVAAAQNHGAEIRTGAAVEKILLDPDEESVRGVVLENGEEISAPLVVSNCDPRRTYFGLIGGRHLTPNIIREVKNIRYEGTTAKINLCLSGLPSFLKNKGEEAFSGHVVYAPSMAAIEKTADYSKYGQLPEKPVLDITIPTILDPELASENGHIMSIVCRFAPFYLRGKDWREERDSLGKIVVAQLSNILPDLKGLIRHRQVITPLDMESVYGLTEGHIYHGQMGMDQLFVLRPIPGFAQHQTPFTGLFLCGAGTHPGGGVTGIPGRNAALEILKKKNK